jgi:hypothetical protein
MTTSKASVNDRSYAVPFINAFSPAAAWYFPLYLCFDFALSERKIETQKKIKYRSAEGKNADCVSPVNELSHRGHRGFRAWFFLLCVLCDLCGLIILPSAIRRLWFLKELP